MREDFKVYQGVFDDFTIKTLYELSIKHFDSIGGPIKTGKEADVYSLISEKGKIVAKIFRIKTSTFRNMKDYIIGDERFPRIGKGKRKMVFAWTQKEFSNLQKAREMGISTPEPISFKNNVLLMEFIGKNEPAPMAKEKPPKQKEKWREMMWKYLRIMEKNDFVHGDLNEFNVLNNKEKPVVIDWAQAVFLGHPLYDKMLRRDEENIRRWLGDE
jgi:RIO kinase 1